MGDSVEAVAAERLRCGWWGCLNRNGYPLLAARVVIGLWFIWFGLKKTEYPFDFLKVIKEYHLLPLEPPLFINLIAVCLPWLEILLGLALLAGVFVRAAGVTLSIMLAVFTTAIFLRAIGHEEYTSGKIAFTAIEFDCGCGAGVVVVYKKLIENSLFFLLSLVAIFSRSQRFCLARAAEPARARPGAHDS